MPRELVVTSPRTIDYVDYDNPDPIGTQVLVRTTVSGVKHGTELNHYRGHVPFEREVFDPVLRLFRPLSGDEQGVPFFPHSLGSWAAGVVEKVGSDVSRFHVGERVHGEWKHRETALMDEAALYPVCDHVADTTMLFSDPARFALAGIRDADIKLGDRVAVFGLGAIGLLVVQMARLSGAAEVYAIDPVGDRLRIACELGVDVALSPLDGDVARAIKEATGGRGVDVALEVSGAYAALQQAIGSVHREGLVVTISFYGDQVGHLDLAREWHHNRINLRSSMPVWGCTHRHQPMWDLDRLERPGLTGDEGNDRTGTLPVGMLPARWRDADHDAQPADQGHGLAARGRILCQPGARDLGRPIRPADSSPGGNGESHSGGALGRARGWYAHSVCHEQRTANHAPAFGVWRPLRAPGVPMARRTRSTGRLPRAGSIRESTAAALQSRCGFPPRWRLDQASCISASTYTAHSLTAASIAPCGIWGLTRSYARGCGRTSVWPPPL